MCAYDPRIGANRCPSGLQYAGVLMISRATVLAASRRALAIAALAAAGIACAVLVMMAPDLYWFLPPGLRRRKLELVLAGFATAYTICRTWATWREAERPSIGILRAVASRLDELGTLALGGWLAVGIGAGCAGLLAGWLPHYLTWPWGRDADTFATLAQSWDAGIIPYRDIRAYNFPGTIYLFW